MEEIKLPMDEKEEAQARETMERMRESIEAEVSGKLEEIPKDMLNDQWKRGGICAMCRRKDYCKTQCSANRDYASTRIQEYIRRKFGISVPRDRMKKMATGK